VLCLAAALVINLPIQQLLPHMQLPNTIRLNGIAGTAFHGTAQEVSINRFPLRDLSYRFKPSCIPLLKICYQVDYEQGASRVAYDLLNGDVEVSEARAEYQVIELAAYMPNMMMQPDGRLELTIDELAIVAGKPAALTGKLIWRDLGVKSDDVTLGVGDYQIDIIGNPQKYDLKLSDLDASLDVSGKGEVMADGQFRVDIKISSATTIDPKVKNVLDLLTKNISYNNYRVEQSGKLPPNITRQLF